MIVNLCTMTENHLLILSLDADCLTKPDSLFMWESGFTRLQMEIQQLLRGLEWDQSRPDIFEIGFIQSLFYVLSTHLTTTCSHACAEQFICVLTHC